MRTQLPAPNHPYPYVVLWCRFMGSYQYYADIQVDLAQRQKQPRNVVHHDRGASWVTLDDIGNGSFRKACELWDQGKLKESDGWPTLTKDGGYYLAGVKH